MDENDLVNCMEDFVALPCSVFFGDELAVACECKMFAPKDVVSFSELLYLHSSKGG